jgi:hypothetical protein
VRDTNEQPGQPAPIAQTFKALVSSASIGSPAAVVNLSFDRPTVPAHPNAWVGRGVFAFQAVGSRAEAPVVIDSSPQTAVVSRQPEPRRA